MNDKAYLKKIESGEIQGLDTLTQGYLDYAKEVAMNRAFPDITDGLKPVQRYALYCAKQMKLNDATSATLVGEVLKYHPHGDATTYDSIVKLVDRSEAIHLPFFKGEGDFGSIYSSDPYAAARYTHVSLHKYTNEFFTAEHGVDLVPNYDASEVYLEKLPVSYPFVLCNASDGIGVGISNKVPSFNINDVCSLVEEYINEGECSTIIVPDFVTKNIIVNTTNEFNKIMRTGKGELKLRATSVIEGSTITFIDMPMGINIERVEREIMNSEVLTQHIASADNYSDEKKGFRLVVSVKRSSNIQQVLHLLYKLTSLEIKYHSNMVFTFKNKIIVEGVFGIIEKWVDWRRDVLKKHNQYELSRLENPEKLGKFIEFLKNTEFRDKIIDLVVQGDSAQARDLVIDTYDLSSEDATWFLTRRLSEYTKGNKYEKQHTDLLLEIKRVENLINNVDNIILADMERIKRTIGVEKPRMTEITNTDLQLIKVTEDYVEKPSAYPVTYLIKDKFIQSLGYLSQNEPKSGEVYVNAMSDSVFTVLSKTGTVYKIYGEDILVSNAQSIGEFIPAKVGMKETDYVTTLLADGTIYLIGYSDGYLSTFDTEVFTQSQLKSHSISRGISKDIDKAIMVTELDSDSKYLSALSSDNKSAGVEVGTVKFKTNTGRTKVFNSTKIKKYVELKVNEVKDALGEEDYEIYTQPKKMTSKNSFLETTDISKDLLQTYKDLQRDILGRDSGTSV